MTKTADALTADVVVVGGRCAGASLARLLAQQGLEVVVVERASFPSDTRSTHAIASAGTLLLQRWGLLDAVLATGAPTSRTIGVKAGAVEATLPLPDGRPGAMAPRRTVLDALMVDAARAAGAEVMEHTSFRGVSLDDSGAVNGIRCTTRDRRELAIDTAVVVGADGVGSPVARAVGARRYAITPSYVSGAYAYFADVPVTQNELAFGAEHCALAFPTNDGLTCIAAVVHDADFGAFVSGGEDAFIRAIGRSSERLASAVVEGRRVTRFHSFRGLDNQRVVPCGPGWALVGDAGYYRDPITGQGIADAFVSAQLLADAVVDGLGGRVPLAAAFDRYHRRRDELTAAVYDVTCELSRYEWTDESILPAFLRYRAAVDSTATAVEEGLSGDMEVAGHTYDNRFAAVTMPFAPKALAADATPPASC